MTTHRVADVHDLVEGGMRLVKAGDTEVLLVHAEGEIRALGAHCTHHHAPMADGLLQGHRLLCPWHQAVFDVTSGAPLEPPALDCLPTYPVTIRGDEVLVEVPDRPEPPVLPELAAPDATADRRLVVILGAGAAGVTAAQELRRAGFQGRVVMISEDRRPPYDRTQCSKEYLSGEAPPEWMPLRPPEFYADAGIEQITATVPSVDVTERLVALPGGSVLRADGLLLATGAVPRRLDVPGAGLAGIHTLRTWDDADRLVAGVASAEKVVIVGASFIAMEAASSLRARDVPSVTIVAPELVPFENVLGERVGGWLRTLHESNGVEFRLGRQVKGFIGNGSVSAVLLDGGEEMAADMVILGVGVRPATDAIRGVELRDDGSLLTDELMRVADGVYAAGDIAAYPDWRTGETVRIEHWRTAQQQGAIAGRNLAGEVRPFRGVPFFWSMQHGTPLGYLGHATSWDEEIVHGDLEAGDFIVYYVGNGRVLAMAASGARESRLNALHELMLLDRVPSVEELRQGERD